MARWQGGKVVIPDLNDTTGQALASQLGGHHIKTDVSSEADGSAAVQLACQMGHWAV